MVQLGLVKGDSENLEGRVLVYSLQKKIDVPRREAIVRGLYASVDFMDFAKITGEAPSTSERVKKVLNKIKDRAEKELPGKVHILAYFGTEIFLASEEEALNMSSDVFYAGTHEHNELCESSNELALKLYSASYESQYLRKLDGMQKLNSVSTIIPHHTHKDYSGQDIKPLILQMYIGRMLEAKDKNDEQSFKYAQNEFIHFASRSNFTYQVMKLCELIKVPGKSNLELIDNYAGIISAIHQEKYEQAACYNKKIEILLKSSK